MSLEEINEQFSYHSPRGNQTARYEKIRAAGKNLAVVIRLSTPSSADQSAALRKVREACMTANAAIAINESDWPVGLMEEEYYGPSVTLPDEVLNPGNEVIEAIAKVTHEANAAYCETLGDMSQQSWDNAPEWQKDSARNGVIFHLSNPDAGDEASHNSWLKQKEADGWIYGIAKDLVAKTHHCMVPFDQLPKEQQLKDKLFRSTVHALAALLPPF